LKCSIACSRKIPRNFKRHSQRTPAWRKTWKNGKPEVRKWDNPVREAAKAADNFSKGRPAARDILREASSKARI
jgi:hypothetical protein